MCLIGHTQQPNPPHWSAQTRTHSPAGAADQSILKMTYVSVHWSKTRWHPYMQAELLVCFFAPSFFSLALSLFRLSCDQRQLSPGTLLFRHKGYVKTRQRLQSCNGTAQLLKRCCVPWWDTCVCRLSVCALEKNVSVLTVSASPLWDINWVVAVSAAPHCVFTLSCSIYLTSDPQTHSSPAPAPFVHTSAPLCTNTCTHTCKHSPTYTHTHISSNETE